MGTTTSRGSHSPLLARGSLQAAAQLGPEHSLCRADLVASCQKDGDCQHREAKGRTDVGRQHAEATLLENASGFKASCRDMKPGLHIAKALRVEDRCREPAETQLKSLRGEFNLLRTPNRAAGRGQCPCSLADAGGRRRRLAQLPQRERRDS